ncbi:hypothetical protein L596_003682 [Steinernema carpocapsae]|uniref:Uncharacterized protein n=1 Tax=Steinernema carpocapsae TaxID=34508 RepID=A0A4U8UT75_STECR|nr:hypothetical protein L596_003682 [Steinernema carpocapsae]
MYFPDEGECITNTESAISKPNHFGREENDEVIYIQNGCAHSLAVQERLAKAAESAEENGKAKAHKPVHKKIVPRKNAAKVATTTVAPIEETTTAEATDSAEESDSSEATTAAAEQEEQTSEGSEEHETEDASSEEAEAEATTESTTTTTTMTTTSTTTTTKVPSSTKRPRKHHKRPSKKTSPTPTPTTSTFAAPDEKKNKESFENEAEGTTEAATIATVSATKLPSEPAKPDEKNKDKETNEAATEEPVATTEEPRKEADIYFSDWSEWTECVNPGERKIRRRMCLNMKKCVGSLMEIGWCPEDLPVQVKSSEGSDEKESGGPVGPVRTPLPVADSKNTAEAGSPPSILPPQMPKRELKPLPKDAPGTANDIWSPWLGVCQHFASGQPCKNHEVIGFESRECIAKDPSLCKGPFFRYCTLKC